MCVRQSTDSINVNWTFCFRKPIRKRLETRTVSDLTNGGASGNLKMTVCLAYFSNFSTFANTITASIIQTYFQFFGSLDPLYDSAAILRSVLIVWQTSSLGRRHANVCDVLCGLCVVLIMDGLTFVKIKLGGQYFHKCENCSLCTWEALYFFCHFHRWALLEMSI